MTATTAQYEGSVKTVYADPKRPDVFYFAFSDHYSVFDWGRMPDTLAHKGRVLSLMGGWLFRQLADPTTWQALQTTTTLASFDPLWVQRYLTGETFQTLCQSGLRHHFLGWTADPATPLKDEAAFSLQTAPMMQVRAVQVVRPQAFELDQRTVYHYPPSGPKASARLIPLEVVFRFGMPAGSSLQSRLKTLPGYAQELGLTTSPDPNQWFARPVVEFFTKLESTDRFLPLQEAVTVSGLSPEAFQSLYDTTLLLALWLFDCFSRHGIALWDGKFEFAWTPDGLMLVDSIGPDELRLSVDGVPLSKELARSFYRNSAWEKALKQAKPAARTMPGADWKTICRETMGESPQPLRPEEKHLLETLYGSLLNHLLEQPVIPDSLPLSALVQQVSAIVPSTGGIGRS